MLRYYEQQGLLRPRRRESGYRDYGDGEEALVRCLCLLKESGLTLATLKQLMPCIAIERSRFEPCPAVLATLRREIGDIEKRIETLESSRRILRATLDDLEAA